MSKETKNGGIGGAPAGWSKIQTDRPLYKGERGKGGPVQGFLLGLLTMPPAQGKVWEAFIVRLTAPCVCTTRDGKTITVPEGGEILVPASHQLRQHLGRAATHPTAMVEVHIVPKGQVPTKAGSMTVYDVHVNPTVLRRGAEERMLSMQAAAPSLPEHAAGVAEDDLPF